MQAISFFSPFLHFNILTFERIALYWSYNDVCACVFFMPENFLFTNAYYLVLKNIFPISNIKDGYWLNW